MGGSDNVVPVVLATALCYIIIPGMLLACYL